MLANEFKKLDSQLDFSELNGDQIPKNSGKSKIFPIQSLKKLLVKGLTKNQILILLKLKENGDNTITSLIYDIYNKQNIPVSTLKLNAKSLKDLNLISYGSVKQPKTAELTDLGKMVIDIVDE